MGKHSGLFGIAVFFGWLAGAWAQPTSPTGTKFDGTYAFVSATAVHKTFVIAGRGGQCWDYKERPPLVIVNGQPHYLRYTGTIGPRGELTLGLNFVNSFDYNRQLIGRIYDDGTVRARWSSNYCDYDFVFRKLSK